VESNRLRNNAGIARMVASFSYVNRLTPLPDPAIRAAFTGHRLASGNQD
jgi:hypothetical protein